MGDRLLVAARKSRKGDAAEDDQYARQEEGAARVAAKDGHVIVATARDTVSSQRPPWERRELRKWMTEAGKLALYDGILVTETDRLARLDDMGWHDIESWCYDHGKCIVTGEGVRFPAREGNDGDYWQWHALKKQARRYWEQTRDKHAGGRAIARASGGFIGRAPFGYVVAGVKYRKRPVPHPEYAALAIEMFQRIADGQPGAAVALWLAQETGRTWRVKAVLDCIRNATYLGERDGAEFEPLVTRGLWDAANAAVAARSYARTASTPKDVHAYSGVIFCGSCGAPMYRHQSSKDGKPVGVAHYRCGRGRRGVPESRCPMPGVSFGAVNDSVHEVMSALGIPEQAQRAEGGDAGKAAELAAIDRAMKAAMAKHDMAEVARLAAAYAERESREAAPVRVWWQPTGKSLGELWTAGDLAARRELLRDGGIGAHGLVMVVNADASAELADIDEKPDVRAWNDEVHGEFAAAG